MNRQDALDDQLMDVAAAAEQMGCYDAADFIRSSVACSRCGMRRTHTLECSRKKEPPARGHKADRWPGKEGTRALF